MDAHPGWPNTIPQDNGYDFDEWYNLLAINDYIFNNEITGITAVQLQVIIQSFGFAGRDSFLHALHDIYGWSVPVAPGLLPLLVGHPDVTTPSPPPPFTRPNFVCNPARYDWLIARGTEKRLRYASEKPACKELGPPVSIDNKHDLNDTGRTTIPNFKSIVKKYIDPDDLPHLKFKELKSEDFTKLGGLTDFEKFKGDDHHTLMGSMPLIQLAEYIENNLTQSLRRVQLTISKNI